MRSEKSTTRARSSRRRGGAVLEAAVVLSIITSVSLGAVQYGYAFYLKHALQQAASAGARVAAMPGAVDSQVQTAVNNHLTTAGFGNLSATTTTSPSSINSMTQGTYVSVTVTASWSRVGINPLPASLGGFSSNRTFSGSMTLMHE